MTLQNDRFSFWVPAHALLVKSEGAKADGSDATGKRWIQGIASTDSLDLQGEVVEQNGIDFSYFLKYGYFNNDHKPGFDNKVGQPTECKVTSKGLWVKGYLFQNHKIADSIWELLNSLSASGASRKVGFSVQGKVLRRRGNRIAKCWIQDIAITPCPVNPTTWAEIAKSLSAQSWDKGEDDEESVKALSAQGSVLVPESLDASQKEARISKSLSFEDAVIYLQVRNGLTRETAMRVAKVAFQLYGKE